MTDAIVLELLALLGPDLCDDGEVILLRVARDAPAELAPAVEELRAGRALADYGRGLLGRLSEAYYLTMRRTVPSSVTMVSVTTVLEASVSSRSLRWWRGPFLSLLPADFRNGVAVLNRLLNQAARIRARSLANPGPLGAHIEIDGVAHYQTELWITGAHRRYVGDDHVWALVPRNRSWAISMLQRTTGAGESVRPTDRDRHSAENRGLDTARRL